MGLLFIPKFTLRENSTYATCRGHKMHVSRGLAVCRVISIISMDFSADILRTIFFYFNSHDKDKWFGKWFCRLITGRESFYALHGT